MTPTELALLLGYLPIIAAALIVGWACGRRHEMKRHIDSLKRAARAVRNLTTELHDARNADSPSGDIRAWCAQNARVK